jgi:hypothetical protein
MAGAGRAAGRQRSGLPRDAGGCAVTAGLAVDVVDVPVELARPVVAELSAGVSALLCSGAGPVGGRS